MIKFQIIIDRKGTKKTIKPFLSKAVSSLALVFSVVVLSTIIGLGIHLVLAYTNPTADPPGDNVEGPINVGDVAQTKVGKLKILEGYQKDNMWGLSESGSISGLMVSAPDGPVMGKDVLAFEHLWTDGDLMVETEIFAPNQDWEHLVGATTTNTNNPDGAYLTCPDGWFLRRVYVKQGAKNSQGWCAAPFRKYDAPVGGGGGGDVDNAKAEAQEAAPGAWESYIDSTWWWVPGAF